MKRLLVISLLGLLVFNAIGYYALIAYEGVEAKRVAIASVQDANLIQFKFPATVYSHVENSDFEFLDGEYSHEGKTYVMVKKRIVNDTVEVYCLHNMKQDLLNDKLGEYVSAQTNDKSQHPASPVKQLVKNFLKEYLSDTPFTIAAPNFVSTTSRLGLSTDTAVLSSAVISILAPPPQSV
jgi:hypothetical protein